VVALAACYHPSYEDCQVSCSTFGCPDGLTCESGMCRTANAVGECAIRPPDGGADGDTGDGSGSAGGALQIAAGAVHTCAACGDGSVWCWGADALGQTGGNGHVQCNPNQTCDPTPVEVELPGTLKTLSAGHDSTCVLVDISGASRLYCMGNNTNGQLGISQAGSIRTLTATAMGDATGFAGGVLHACEIIGSRVECQGGNGLAQLGNGTFDNQPHPVPMATQPPFTAMQLAAGDTHTCAVVPNTSPMCWGDDTHGAVDGSPSTNPVQIPTQNASIPTVHEVAAGAGHTCALGDNVYCWGRNQFGEVGRSPPGPDTTGLTVLSIPGAMHIAAGGTQSCALTTDGIVACWGSPDGTIVASPTQVQLPMAATALSVGASHACAILIDGSVWCWGTNVFGELGDGTFDTESHGPTRALVCQ
jgi:hypothetical protein